MLDIGLGRGAEVNSLAAFMKEPELEYCKGRETLGVCLIFTQFKIEMEQQL